MKKILGIVGGLLFVALLAWTGVVLFKKSSRPPVVYATVQPVRADIVQKTVATGSVVPRKEVAIKPLVSGIIDALDVEEGQQVEQGERVAAVRVIPEMGRLSEAESRVNRAEIALGDAERDHGRAKSLFEQGTTARAELDRAEIALAQAREELTGAKDALDIVRTGTSARVARAATTVVRATISGTVLEVPVEVGNSVIQANNFNEGTTIASVADMSDMVFEGKVDESEVGKIRAGMELVLTIGALPERSIRATLEPSRRRPICSCAPTTAPTPTSCSTSASRCWRSTRGCCSSTANRPSSRSRPRPSSSSAATSRPVSRTASRSRSSRGSPKGTRSRTPTRSRPRGAAARARADRADS
jgi:HlyD family secretion protein